MPLRFLVPAFLVGLAALAIPLAVHLTRRPRARVVDFPSLMFLEGSDFRAESRRRIHHWLLLLARALAVALVVAAFARPFLAPEEGAAAAGSGPVERVVLLDRSYSMQADGRWDRAREAAREALEGSGPLDRSSLVTFARSAEVVVRSAPDPARVRAALDTLEVTAQATSYGPGLKLAQTLLEESELARRELVLVGDFQRTGWTGEEGVNLPPGTSVTPVDVAPEEGPLDDRAVGEVTLARERVQGRDRVTATARLTRVGGQEETVSPVVLEVDGREVQRREVTLPAEGAATVTFEPFNLSESDTRLSVRLLGTDALPADDVRHLVASPGRAYPVLILDDGSGPGASSLFLRRALDVSRESAFQIRVRSGGGLTADDLEGISVVVVNDRPVPAGLARTLGDFVAAGGGLVVAAGERLTWPSDRADLLPGELGGARDPAPGRGERLGRLDYDHPVFEVFQGPRTGDFTGARFFRSRRFDVTPGDTARVLARFDDGAVALAERPVGDGRVLVWTSTLDDLWNDLAVQPVYLPFVHELVRYASGRPETVASFDAGQVIDVTDARAMATAGLGDAARALADAESRVAIAPDGTTLPLPVGSGPHFLELDQAGFYRIRPPGQDGVRPLAVAVNVELEEADPAGLDVDEVVASIASRSAASPTAGGSDGARAAELRLQDQERRQSFWRYLLLGALVLFVAETVVANRVSPRRAVR